MRSSVLCPPTQDPTSCDAISVPLLSLALSTPVEGFSVLTDWLKTSADIWSAGYEPSREPIECRLESVDLVGCPLKPSSLIPTRGITRVSIVLFALMFSYQKLQFYEAWVRKLEVLGNPGVKPVRSKGPP